MDRFVSAAARYGAVWRGLVACGLLAAAVTGAAPAGGDGGGELACFVSPRGDDANPGTSVQPLRTLAAARDRLRGWRQRGGDPRRGATVHVRPGRYVMTRTLSLMAEDGGTSDGPVVYRGEEGGKSVICGGHPVDPGMFAPVSDAATLARLHPVARGQVVTADLEGLPVAALFKGKGDYGMISWDGHVLQLAQWPNRGYHHIREIQDKGPTTRWLKPGEKPAPYSEAKPTGGMFSTHELWNHAAWQREFDRTGDMLVEGYLHNDWYFQRERVGRIHAEGMVQLLRHTRYGIEKHIPGVPRRVRVLNVLCELDQAGEWYVDRREKRLYVWPVSPLTKQTSIAIMGGPSLVSLKDAEHVVLRDLVFEDFGGVGVMIQGGEHNVVGGCTIRNGIGLGVRISGGYHNGINGCDFYGLYSAFSVSGGDRRTLTRCDNYAENNDVRDCRLRGYGVIAFKGVGLRFAHNLVHDMNGAVMFQGCNDFLMEYNEFCNMGWEMGDWNVAYCGAQWWSHGNVLRYNFVHHLMELPGAYPVGAFRNDDGGAGMACHGNVFYKSGRYAVAFSGPANTLENNVVLETGRLLSSWFGKSTPEQVRQAWADLKRFGTELPRGDKGDYLWLAEKECGKEGWQSPPWSNRYPAFKQVMDSGNPWAQTFCSILRNYGHGLSGTPIYVHRGSTASLPASCRWEHAHTIDPAAAFVDPGCLDFSFKDSFACMPGFERIPFGKIGLYKGDYRRVVPDKDRYRRALQERYAGIRSSGGRYDMARINARYPAPAYHDAPGK